MKKIILMLMGICQVCCGKSFDVQIFFHRGCAIDQIVFYCPCPPAIITSSKTVQKGGVAYLHDRLMLQGCRITDADLERVDALQKSKEYLLKFEQQNNGVVLDLLYNPEKVSVSQHTFTSIKKNAGVSIVVEKKQHKKKVKKLSQTIVIDAGHGGHDSGALSVNNICEKITTLEVATQLQKMLIDLGYEVFMTRSDDTFIPLDERTTMANLVYKADLFISLHVNSAPNPKAMGIETFYTQGAVFDPPLARSQEKDDGSFRLAKIIQQGILETVSLKYPVVNRGFKRSASHVMFGTEMPAILVELGFNSSPEEAHRLDDREYQQSLCDAIAASVDAYLKSQF